MSINTYSAFTYGHTITEDNQWINFSENGIDELSAQIDIGAYTLGEFASKVASALNEVGTLNYTCEVNTPIHCIFSTAGAHSCGFHMLY